jgi:integral membrane protein
VQESDCLLAVQDTPQISRRVVNGLRVVSLVDGLLLVPLIYAAFAHEEGMVDILGPSHGTLFLVLVITLASYARRGWWSWKFVAGVVVLGPIVSIPGLERIHRRLP